MASDGKSNMHLIFKVRDTLYGFELPYVQEVIQLPELTCIAKMPRGIAGFLNLREEIICIVDMPVTLGYSQKQYSLNDYIIILRKDNEMSFGVLVSEILDIKEVKEEQNAFGDTQETKSNVLPLVSKIARFDNEIIFILDPILIYQKVCNVYSSMQVDEQILNNHQHVVEFNASPEEKAIFVERAHTLAKKLTEQKAKDVTPLAVVQLNQEFFGVDPEIIKEFKRIEDYTPLPTGSAANYLLGFINMRGEILTLVDLWQVLKGKNLEIKENSKILVIMTHDVVIGILIDDVLDVIFVKPEEFRPVPLGMQKAHEEYIKQTVMYEKDVLGVLNLSKVIESVIHAAEAEKKT